MNRRECPWGARAAAARRPADGSVPDAVFVLFVARKTNGLMGKRNDHLRRLAETLGLAVTGGDPMFPSLKFLRFLTRPLRLEGQHRGIRLQVYHYQVSSGQSSTTYATVRATLENERGLAFTFSKEGIFSKVGKSLGMQDVATGDARFDGLFVVKCNDPEFIARALIPQVRERFVNAWETHKARGTIKLKNDTLSYDEAGSIRDDKTRHRAEAVAELICDLGGIVKYYNR